MEPWTALTHHPPQLLLGQPRQCLTKINRLPILLDYRDSGHTETIKITLARPGNGDDQDRPPRSAPRSCDARIKIERRADHGEGGKRRKPFRSTDIPLPGSKINGPVAFLPHRPRTNQDHV